MTLNEDSQWLADREERNGCVGSLVVFVLLIFIMGAIINNQREPEASLAAPVTVSPADAVPVLAQVIETPAPEDTTAPALLLPATATLLPTAMPSPTPTATAAATLPPPSPTVMAALENNPLLPPTATLPPPPLPTPQEGYSRTLKVPILMYHYISTPSEDADIYRVDLSVEPATFREQMAYLAANGYSTIDFYELSLAITNQIELPPRPVILTLDDGYVDNYLNAFPVLQEFGLKATFFIVTDFIDKGRQGYMNWAMIEEMAAAGMRMEPHSKTHAELRGQEHDYLVWQILGSQETLAAHIGYTPRYFSYPGGRYDEDTIAVLEALNFWGAVTTHSGKEHGFEDRYLWTRLRVRHTTTLPVFADLVHPGE